MLLEALFPLKPKKAGGSQFDRPCSSSKTAFSRKRVKHWVFVTFSIIIRHTFPENFIEIPLVVRKI